MVQRVYGLSGSGMDVDSMVKQLMQAQRSQYSYLYQNRDLITWKKQGYNEMYSAISTFQSTVTSYKLSSALSIKSATSSTTSVATATANADAANISHDLTVSQLASGVKMTSSGQITTGTAKDSLANQFYGGTSPGTFDLKITNGTSSATITVDPTKSVYELVNQINNAGVNIAANYDTTLDRFIISTKNTGSSSSISFTGSGAAGLDFVANKLKLATGTVIGEAGVTSSAALTADQTQTLASQFGLAAGTSFNLMINGSAVAISDTDTLDQVMANINAAAGSSVASYTANKFSLQPGSGNIIDLAGSDAAALSFLSNNLKVKVGAQQGTDAKFTLDGAELTQSSNNFTISGVSYNITAVGSTTVSVTNDVDKMVTSIQNFVDKYNTLLDAVNAKLSEERDRDYMPLTSDQKSSMSQADIDAWQKKAQTGVLQNDGILQKLVVGMRNAISNPIASLTGKYKTAASIGITSGDYSEGGHLYLDANKLKTALQEDPDAVAKIFGTSGNSSDSQNGIAFRLDSLIKGIQKTLVSTAGVSTKVSDSSSLGKQLTEYNKTIKKTETRLTTMETNYYSKFNQMEVYIQKMNSQSSWLSQQFSS